MSISKEGYYRIAFTNEENKNGMGMVTLDSNIIAGCSIAGDIWDGRYTYNPRTECFDGVLKITFPKGTQSLLTGKISDRDDYAEEIPISFPKDFEETIIPLKLPGFKALNVTIKKLRNFPS